MKLPVLCAIAATLTMGMAHAQEGDASAGKTLYASKCAHCHGQEGAGMASFPALAGRDAEYIKSRLEQYRAGEKVGANSGVMIPNAKSLSDEDINNLAAHISSNFQ